MLQEEEVVTAAEAWRPAQWSGHVSDFECAACLGGFSGIGCSIGREFNLGALQVSCGKSGTERKQRLHEIPSYRVSSLNVDITSRGVIYESQLIGVCGSIKMSEGRAKLFALSQLWFQQGIKEIRTRYLRYR